MSMLLALNEREAEIVATGLMCLGETILQEGLYGSGTEYSEVMQILQGLNALIERNFHAVEN